MSRNRNNTLLKDIKVVALHINPTEITFKIYCNIALNFQILSVYTIQVPNYFFKKYFLLRQHTPLQLITYSTKILKLLSGYIVFFCCIL